MNLKISVEADSYRRAMRKMPRAIKNEVAFDLQQRVGHWLAGKIMWRTRVKTGRLKRSTYHQKGSADGMVLTIGQRTPYAVYVEYGRLQDRNIERVIIANLARIRWRIANAVSRAWAKVRRG